MPDAPANPKTALAAVPLFAGLPTRHLNSAAKLTKVVTHAAGNEVAAQGRGALAFHVITDGSATVTVNGTLRRTLGPGDFFGEISLLDGEPRSATVAAGPNGMTTLALNRTDFLGLIDKEPSFSKAVIVALCGRIRSLEQSM